MLIVAQSDEERSALRTALRIWAALGASLADFASVSDGVATIANASTVAASATRTLITISAS